MAVGVERARDYASSSWAPSTHGHNQLSIGGQPAPRVSPHHRWAAAKNLFGARNGARQSTKYATLDIDWSDAPLAMPTNRRARARPPAGDTSQGRREPELRAADDTRAQQNQGRHHRSLTLSVLVLGVIVELWRRLSELRVVAQRAQPPENFGYNVNMAFFERFPEQHFLLPAIGVVEEST